ncbi:hypothetical protein AB0M36_37215 [Actinoplanes sp. NPDC051346]|uniref:hypothetical protein n=1 Tax=Actinoplanes sp. NPDC051346 TaxID=3155048 RepID=UPI00343FBB06
MLARDEAVDYLRGFDGIPPESLQLELLSDGTWLLERQAFWASLLYDAADEELLDALFGSGEGTWLTDQIDELWKEIEQSGRWPVLRFGTQTGDFALAIWHVADETEGHDFVVLPGDGRCISVAAVAAHSYGPGLSWPEAKRLIGRGTLGSAAQRLLLLVRALGDTDMPTDVVGRVAEALLAVGDAACSKETAMEAAQQLVTGREVRWSVQDDVLICDSEYAARRPGGLPPEDLVNVTQALR